jgi:predicted O-methyltransferase YrrM
MQFWQATRLSSFLSTHRLRDCLELGFYHGVSSAYIASILHANGGGHLTTIDLETAREKSPSIHDLLRDLGLADIVTVVHEPRSYTWRLMKLIEEGRGESFDFSYIDGGHFWDVTGFGFFLVEKLLRSGGWILFDDLDWKAGTLADRHKSKGETLPSWLARLTQEELQTPQIRKVWELLVKQHPGFESFREEGQWGFARKKLAPLSAG